VPVAFDAVGILKDAPHPNAARLLIEFLTSEDGQKVPAEGRLSAGADERTGDEAGPAARGRRFAATFFRPDETYDKIPALDEGRRRPVQVSRSTAGRSAQ
jgi:ABC-type Fe3+ transport system substrate-binding protein